MAFHLVQEFDKVHYRYDRLADVLDVSFGPPAPAVALQVEDWLALRIGLNVPVLQGMTVVGFRTIFEKVNRYVEEELPRRMKRLSKAHMEISYDDSTDTLIARLRNVPVGRSRTAKKRSAEAKQRLSVFEPLLSGAETGSKGDAAKALRSVYVEKSLPSKEFVGVKIFEYTKCGPAAMEAIFGTLIDTLFSEPHSREAENTRLFTDAIIQHVDWQHLAQLAA
jgi:hypothetical protein